MCFLCVPEYSTGCVQFIISLARLLQVCWLKSFLLKINRTVTFSKVSKHFCLVIYKMPETFLHWVPPWSLTNKSDNMYSEEDAEREYIIERMKMTSQANPPNQGTNPSCHRSGHTTHSSQQPNYIMWKERAWETAHRQAERSQHCSQRSKEHFHLCRNILERAGYIYYM